MANLTYVDKLQLEKLLGMGSGYVLNFSDKTLSGIRCRFGRDRYVRAGNGCRWYFKSQTIALFLEDAAKSGRK